MLYVLYQKWWLKKRVLYLAMCNIDLYLQSIAWLLLFTMKYLSRHSRIINRF